MGFVDIRTVARFIFKGPGGSVEYKESPVPPGERDPLVLVLGCPPQGALGVQFYDQVTTEVANPLTGEPVICLSEPLYAPGTTYYEGTVLARKELETGTISLPVLARQAVLARMDQGWGRVILFKDGSMQPFFKDDVLLPPPLALP